MSHRNKKESLNKQELALQPIEIFFNRSPNAFFNQLEILEQTNGINVERKNVFQWRDGRNAFWWKDDF
ncbi:hypothetical protein Csa_020601 [Cucumis sativus]|uniref:Uncharacterized protein n=1 Tax=Cucumis sativus TaxID=3659 RepID=A0A0A0KBA3_CUCSA|nr:hypothetical protein Csa_020601 [Cucumis sativus]